LFKKLRELDHYILEELTRRLFRVASLSTFLVAALKFLLAIALENLGTGLVYGVEVRIN